MWSNLSKILSFALPVNFAQGMAVLGAYVVNMPDPPLTAMQVSTHTRISRCCTHVYIYKYNIFMPLCAWCG